MILQLKGNKKSVLLAQGTESFRARKEGIKNFYWSKGKFYDNIAGSWYYPPGAPYNRVLDSMLANGGNKNGSY